jgi:replicative DNA helicase
MRNGRLAEPDWPKISNAVARLGDAPLFIDDNPNTTVMEIRAKARRLKARNGGLGLIIVDYLQLMSGGSAENRQLEVSSISRGLKILARELEVPVVALSQLSRQLEARTDKRPNLADLRESGCMPASTRLLRADTGEEVTLGELVLSQEQPLVWSLDDSTLKMVARRLLKTFPSGIKPVFRLRLRSGYEVEATANHRFRTVEGWKRLDELAIGDHLATPRVIPSPVLVSADRFNKAAVGDTNLLGMDVRDGWPAASDVYWDEVVEISAVGAQPTFDATVEDTHNFVANGIIAHNSLEQDADVVMFLYRDELYNPESADRGVAEVIVAKHRNGPTGKVQLSFLEQYTKFVNMARV